MDAGRDPPASELKLNRSFLTGLTDDGRAMSMVRSTVELAHSLGLRLMAEGVETDADLDLVTGLACDGAQGHLLSRPVPGAELIRRLAAGPYPSWHAPATRADRPDTRPESFQPFIPVWR